MGKLTPLQEYNRRYYKFHKKRIIKKRSRRYRQDPQYREEVRARSREFYRRTNNAVPTFGEPVGDMPDVVEYEGRRYYPLSYAAEAAAVNTQTIRRWHKVGIIPDMMQEETGRKWRWFTAHQLVLLVKMRGYNRMTAKQKAEAKSYVAKTWDDEDTGTENIVQVFGR